MRKIALTVAALILLTPAIYAQRELPGLQDAPDAGDEKREILPSVYGLAGLKRAGFYVTDISSDAQERTGITGTMVGDYFSQALAETDTVSFANRGTGVPWFHVNVRLRPLKEVKKTAYCVDLKLVQTVYVMTDTRSVVIPIGTVWQAPGKLQVAGDDVCAKRVKAALQRAIDQFEQQYRRENGSLEKEGTKDSSGNGEASSDDQNDGTEDTQNAAAE